MRRAFVPVATMLAIQVMISISVLALGVMMPAVARDLAIDPKLVGLFTAIIYAVASVTALAAAEDSDQIVSFDAALRRLEAESPDAARVVQLRFFAGLSVEQTALAMGISDRTVGRLWNYARAWLHRAVRESEHKD